MTFNRQRALELLRDGTGQAQAGFRAGQEQAIAHLVEAQGRLLVVQRTGWGKSFVYFIATKLLREAGNGPALLISPLLSLMRNQIAAAERMGVRAAKIDSSNQAEWSHVEEAVEREEVDILLISPERLASERFRSRTLPLIAQRLSLLVVDEAHCISDWGHDFRPDYRRLERIVQDLPANVRLLATTATANDRVMRDLRAVLGPELAVLRGALDRPSLALQTLRLESQAERLAWLAAELPKLPGSGIIYALTIRDAERVAAWLKSRGMNVAAYHGEAGVAVRPELEDLLLGDQLKALVATMALGMGFDKPNLAFVVHYQAPGSVVTYYQQVGRAGRAIDQAYGVLLSGREETHITDYFIRSAFPTRDEVATVLQALARAPEGLSKAQLLRDVNLSQGRIETTLKLLALEAAPPILEDERRWRLTPQPLTDAFWRRIDRLTELRREEQRQMQEYVRLEGGHMAFLVAALDGDPNTVETNTRALLPTTCDRHLVREAEVFLRGSSLIIEPRKQWPDGSFSSGHARQRITAEHRMETGRSLCFYGEGEWGELVQRGKYLDGRFGDPLVEASARLIREWNPQPAPQWVTCIPSLRHPALVPDFAARLAGALNLPFRPVLTKTEDRPEQKSRQNSAQLATNVDGSLEVRSEELLPGAVLLVDDVVDSRWTLTIASYLLRYHGCEKVLPFALSTATTGSDE